MQYAVPLLQNDAMTAKNIHPAEKNRLHLRNKHRERYDFAKLTDCTPELKAFVRKNDYGDNSIDFADAEAVKTLNQALLKLHYGIGYWQIPAGYLCPPIPGRADYIHNIADLLRRSFFGNIPQGSQVKGLDVGIGANCVYPIIGAVDYGWKFIGADIDPVALNSAQAIIDRNDVLSASVECRLQPNKGDFFYGVLLKDEKVDFTICNPPFYGSATEAKQANMRKVNNLNETTNSPANKNFGGQPTELVYEGGEERFVRNMVRQSIKFSDNVLWFSTLVSKQSNLRGIYRALEELEAVEVTTIPMGQGNKSSRMVAWTFQTKAEQNAWVTSRWKRDVQK